MKRIVSILILSVILWANPCFANYLNLGDFTVTDINKNLLLDNNTFKDIFPTYYGCFAYINNEKAILNGKPFFVEYACVKWNPNSNENDSFPIVTGSIFYFNSYSLEQVRTRPYYFTRMQVLYDIEAFFTNLPGHATDYE